MTPYTGALMPRSNGIVSWQNVSVATLVFTPQHLFKNIVIHKYLLWFSGFFSVLPFGQYILCLIIKYKHTVKHYTLVLRFYSDSPKYLAEKDPDTVNSLFLNFPVAGLNLIFSVRVIIILSPIFSGSASSFILIPNCL